MKNLLVLLSLLALATVAFAQDTDPDGIGVYFDLDGISSCGATAAPYETAFAYLLITNPSDPTGVSGWEANVTVTGNALAPQWILSAGLDVDMSAEGFQVGIGTDLLALPAAPAVLLATWSGLVPTPADVQDFLVTDVPGSVSFDGTPGYASGGDAGLLIPLQVSSGFPYVTCASINDCVVIGNDDMSFGGVKSLFR